MLSSMGVEVVDERPYELEGLERPTYIYEFGLRYGRSLPDARPRALPGRAARGVGRFQRDRRLQRAGARAPGSPGARPPCCAPTRSTCGRGTRRSRSTTSRRRWPATSTSPGCWSTCSRRASTPAATAWRTTRRPAPPGSHEMEGRIARALDDVASLDHDRILRSYLTHIRATLRTNYFQAGPGGGGVKPYMSFKLEPSAIPDLPEPRPRFEIFVYSPRVEGVHLRFGAVARGGLRWSDRRDDFRTEVLGLVKAQMVKNTVIVPVGRQGRLLLQAAARLRPARRLARRGHRLLQDLHLRAARHHRQPRRRARPCRRRAGGAPRRRRLLPGGRRRQGHRDVLRHRQRRGAGLRLLARRRLRQRRLGRATTTRRWASPPAAPGSRCSGTSASAASTARPRTSPASASATCPATCSATACSAPSTPGWWRPSTTATSSSTPTPTPATSYAERQRLFGLARSSWQDYDRDLISEGGGVYPRSLKSIRLNAAVRAGPRHRRRRGGDDARRADARDPHRAGRPALERRHRHLRQGRRRDPRRRRRQGQRRDPGRRPRAAGHRASARAATSA